MESIKIVYKDSDGFWQVVPVFSDLPDNSSVDFEVCYDRVLIADGTHPTRYISISKDGDLESGDIGLDAPQNILAQDTSGANNPKVDSEGATDTGMGIEYGNIIQYVHTIEDKYGSESNPSPISTFDTLIYRYPDADKDLGYYYLWQKTISNGYDASQYDAEQKLRLKWWNIYRRDIRFREGILDKQFVKVYRKLVDTNAQSQSYEDTSADNMGDVSYDHGKAPASELVADTGGTIFLGAMTKDVGMFPFQWDKYAEITLTNDNQTDYINATIAMAWNPTGWADLTDKWDIDNWSWATYLNNPDKIRLFHEDMVTPIPVLYKHEDPTLYVYAQVPVLNRESTTKLYLCLADDADGVTNAKWHDIKYGQFLNFDSYTDDQWAAQTWFDRCRVRSQDVKMCYSVLYRSMADAEGNATRLINWADMVNNTTESWSYCTDYPSYATQVVAFNDTKNITAEMLKFTDNEIKYDLGTFRLSENFLFVFDGFIGDTDIVLFKCDDFIVKSTTIGSQWVITVIIGYDILGVPVERAIATLGSAADYGRHIQFVGYKKGDQFYSVLYQGFGTTNQTTTVSPQYVDSITTDSQYIYLLSATNNTSYLNKFELYDDINITPGQFTANAQSYICNTPIMLQPIGARPHSDYNNWTENQENVTFDCKLFDTESLQNRVQWSDVNGQYFNALAYKQFKEAVNAIVIAPSFLKMQYQNTLIIFTRNTVSRMPLTDDLMQMAERPDNVVPEYQSGGLYAKHSVVTIANALFWFSENGVMMWSPEGLRNISANIIDIPLNDEYLGLYIPERNQYWLHDNDRNITYVYHLNTGVWTTFSGLDIKCHANLTGGSDDSSKTLFLKADEKTFHEYPAATYDDADYIIKTKQFVLDNWRPVRYRCVWEKGDTPASIKAITYNPDFDTTGRNLETENETTSPNRFDWIILPNGFWGEYIQFEFNDAEALTRLDLDIKEGI